MLPPSVSLSINIQLRPGMEPDLVWGFVSSDDATFTAADVARLLAVVQANVLARPDTVIPSISQVMDAEAESLPEGWESTLDGVDSVNGMLETNVVRATDGMRVKVPVLPSSTADNKKYAPPTQRILAAFDAANPPQEQAEAQLGEGDG